MGGKEGKAVWNGWGGRERGVRVPVFLKKHNNSFLCAALARRLRAQSRPPSPPLPTQARCMPRRGLPGQGWLAPGQARDTTGLASGRFFFAKGCATHARSLSFPGFRARRKDRLRPSEPSHPPQTPPPLPWQAIVGGGEWGGAGEGAWKRAEEGALFFSDRNKRASARLCPVHVSSSALATPPPARSPHSGQVKTRPRRP